ncbi:MULTISPECIES: phosphonate metabolism protein PhnM [Clostridium]|uniref:phosphonate metabolism protein PhnM n=2 Tax=Clostridiaceae TaxID=31979 RepID=UPI0005FB74F9|nr:MULTISPECIES: phosphonate metabolism protein PhnM [Clostridium]KJZ83513.1 Metal-dependent hydrolase involved in phosphonate metabolism [Clostridium sp. IBUN125C]KJZ95641.1 Metal-dependent hydrolase involved in phosphonate metabolism [Clostridium sp. IBUN62F]MDU1228840.1 phosphonate metabolism protein PhnM [Clostridium sp.]MDU2893533.1 phosphonate metabolism protein PhnM [Clostridium sp.]MDU3005608.1 phosphonate metabolism protein PhnM [Clostridium sp.]
MYLLTNGKIITEEGIIEGYDILIENDIIKKICKNGEVDSDEIEVINAYGGFISPGFIDIHADYIENMSSPRPTSIMDFNLSLRETEKVLINTGITTMYHSLSLYGKDIFENKPIRSDENVIKLIDTIENTQNKRHLIRHRFHARFEIDNVKGVERLKKYIRDGKINLLSFMDHTPGQGQYRNIETYRKTLKGYKDVTDSEIDEMIEERQFKDTITSETIEEIAHMAKDRNISIASHDDDSFDKIDFIKGIGATISEFPITMDVAKYAREKGMFTIAGAPNVLLGKSHSGNLSASEAIKDNCIDILCSDYYPAAMLHSVFILNEKYNMDLCEMFKLITINPAKAVKIDNILGSIKEGKKADILIIEKLEELPVITSVFVDGKLMSKINYRM